MKADIEGNEEWNQTFGGTDRRLWVANYGKQTTDGGYVLTGYSQSFGSGESDVVVNQDRWSRKRRMESNLWWN